MSTNIKLTDTQRQVLEHAANQPDGRLVWFPENVKGGARQKVVDGLFNKALITRDGSDNWFVAAEGYDALGLARPTPAIIHPDPEIEAAVTAAETQWVKSATQEKQAPAKQLIKISVDGKPRIRENSKQAAVIEMLKRPEGATIRQICEVTKWQPHTVRGTFAGAFKKKLGLNLTSEKPEGSSERVYHVG